MDESQLVFTAKQATSMDCCAMLSEIHYVSGDQNGYAKLHALRLRCLQTWVRSLLLWDMNRKKPCYTLRHPHGENSWICAVATVPYSDLIASGTCGMMTAACGF